MKKTYVVAIVIIAVMSLWMLSGLFKSSSHKETAVSEKSEITIPRVRVKHLVASEQRLEVSLRGRTEAKRLVDVKAEISGRVVAVPVDKGQRVNVGDVLCQLAEDDHLAKLDFAKAALEKATIDYDGALRLKDQNLISAVGIATNKAALENARAMFKMEQVSVDHLKIKAPFAGFIEDRPAQIGSLIERGGICARLFDESSLLATGQASEKDVQFLRLGQKVEVQLINGERLTGVIRFIAQTADAQTRAYKVEATLNEAKGVRDGITAQIIVPLEEVLAHRISPAVLALDDKGLVGVRIVNDKKIIEFHLVNVVKETAEGVWITGLPNEVALITVGQELVIEGDKVETVDEDAPKSTETKTQPTTDSDAGLK